jgi:tetratricopeptide (TPR) repeat protein
LPTLDFLATSHYNNLVSVSQFSRLSLSLFILFLILPATLSSADHFDNWLEVRSPNFIVISNSGEREARRIASQFEQIREVFHSAFPALRTDLGKPVLIFALKNEDSLKSLLPSFWETKGHMHPAGLYVSREECDLVVVRTDLQGENPYEIIYHEYTHALFRLNFRDIPLWMNEGFAEFLGNTSIGEKEVQLGSIPRANLEVLRTNKFIPIETLLQVDKDSPYYNEQNRTSSFYAESWAVVHYLMLDPNARNGKLLANFLAAWDASNDQIVSAQKAFGDLKKFSQTMEAYARQDRFYVSRFKLSVHDDPKSYPSRALPLAETQALRGIFFVYTQRPAEAKAALDDALAADSHSPVVHQGLGVFAWYAKQDPQTALDEFAKAVPQTPPNYLPYYMGAMIRSRSMSAGPDTADSLAALDKVIQMNPRFAPAYAVAANFYSRDPKQYDNAVKMGKQAVQLDPANLTYAISYGFVLVNIGKAADAKQLAVAIEKAAKAPHDKANLLELKTVISSRESYDAEVAAYSARNSANKPVTVTVPPAGSSTPDNTNPNRPPSQPPVPATHEHTTDYFLEGTIQKVDCASGDASRLTLLWNKTPLKFRVSDLSQLKLSYIAPGKASELPPCSDWKGHHVKISFRQLDGKDFVGDLLSIQFF